MCNSEVQSWNNHDKLIKYSLVQNEISLWICLSIFEKKKRSTKQFTKNFRNKGEGGGRENNVNFYSMDKQEAYNGEGVSSILASNLVIMKVSGMEFLAKEAWILNYFRWCYLFRNEWSTIYVLSLSLSLSPSLSP